MSTGAGGGVDSAADAARPRTTRQGLIVRSLDGETLVYDTRRHRMHCLGPLLARIWRACSGRRTPAQIAARVSSVAAPVDEPVVRMALARLRRAHLVERESTGSSVGRRVTAAARREALRHVAGLAGLALVTLSAPTSLQAATCTTLADCRALGNRSCTGLPCCSGPGVPAGATCNKKGNGRSCDCS